MRALASRYPVYKWEENVGYSTAWHLKSIAEHGITPHHRRSFLPVRQISFDFGTDVPDILDAGQMAALIDEAAAGPAPTISP